MSDSGDSDDYLSGNEARRLADGAEGLADLIPRIPRYKPAPTNQRQDMDVYSSDEDQARALGGCVGGRG
jgi:hypothetical protein